MAIETPEETARVEDRIKVDVQREAPDSNPYINTHWLRSLIAGFARRIFDFYKDLNRTELRVMPDTADSSTAPRWGKIYVGAKNQSTIASGSVIATGVAGSLIGVGAPMQANSLDYITTSNATIALQSINVDSITRSGTTATVTTSNNHNLASAVPVTISGAVETDYNVTGTQIVVTGLKTFTYQVSGSPSTPASGTILAGFTSARVEIDSSGFGDANNLTLDTPIKFQTPIVGVDETATVSFETVGGGSDEESTDDYKLRYLDKIRNPVAHFNAADIIAKAKEVTGVTRVFVEEAGKEIGTIGITSITRSGNIATVTTSSAHGFEDGFQTTITGADQADYNVVKVRIIIESTTIFHYIVDGTPATPATTSTTLDATTIIPLGTVRTFFMRDNDDDTIPSAAEVATVKAQIDTIRPANTSDTDNIVQAPTAVVVPYTFTELTPDTATMRTAVQANIKQFHEEETTVGVNVDQDAYRAFIKNTVDTETGQTLTSFELSTPTTDIIIASGEIAIDGLVTFNV